jgi:RND family efflux transporter MFP subunit
MNDKAMLLSQLRLDRTEDVRAPAPGKRLWWIAGSVTALVVLAGAGYVWHVRAHEPVPVVAAAPVAPQTPAVMPRVATAMDASGYVVPAREATVSAKTVGRLVELLVEEGQPVTAGQIIARVDDSNTLAAVEEAEARLEQARVMRHAAEVALDDARRIFTREERQHAANVISAQQFDSARAQFNAAESDSAVKARLVDLAAAQVEVARRTQDDTVMRAPFAGLVTVRTAQIGEIVSPMAAGGGFTRTGICTIVDMDSLGVEVDVSENMINRVHEGQPATVKLNAYPDWEIPAEVIAIVPVADRSKATVKVRVGFKVKDPRILPEGGARVAFLETGADREASRADDTVVSGKRLADNIGVTTRN